MFVFEFSYKIAFLSPCFALAEGRMAGFAARECENDFAIGKVKLEIGKCKMIRVGNFTL